MADQELPIRYLSAILRKGSIPAALLFTGPEGAGKIAAAIAFAMGCNCFRTETEKFTADMKEGVCGDGPVPCGDCRACRKILSGNHPDVLTIKPAGNLIKISQIRNLCQRLAIKPHEGRLRVVIFQEAGVMNQEAGNALLKILEEPPERTVLILTTRQKSDLLPTIVSRCMHIRFRPVSIETKASRMAEELDMPGDDALVRTRMLFAGGERLTAEKQDDWIDRRSILMDAMENIQDMRLGTKLAFAEFLASQKEDLPFYLEAIKTWLRDLVVCSDAPEMTINRDLLEKIRRIARKYSRDALMNKVDAVMATEDALKRNCNPRLALEKMILTIARN